MLRRALWVPAVCALFAAPAAAQLQNDLLDVFTVQVKPDKMAQFDAAGKKIVAANRQNKGSDWVALAQEYGQGYTVRFISTRPTFAAIEEASQAFMAAMGKAYGKAATEQIFRDVRMGKFHPGNTFLAHEAIGKLCLGVNPDDKQRWG